MEVRGNDAGEVVVQWSAAVGISVLVGGAGAELSVLLNDRIELRTLLVKLGLERVESLLKVSIFHEPETKSSKSKRWDF